MTLPLLLQTPAEALADSLHGLDQRIEGRAGCRSCYHMRRAHADGEPCAECVRWRDRTDEWGLTAARARYAEWDRPNPYADWQPCTEFKADAYADDEDEEGDTEAVGVELGMPKLVAWKLVELNDITLEGVDPEERYRRVYAWVERHLLQEAVA